MQRIIKKFLIFFIYFILALPLLAREEPISLARADSLFEKGAYTEALDIYEQSWEQRGEASPQMLKKMAMIREGLGDFTQALFYLNLYQVREPSFSVMQHMRDLAHDHELRGYEPHDGDYFWILYQQNYQSVLVSFLLLSGIATVWVLYFQYKQFYLPVRFISLLIMLNLLFFIGLTQIREEPQGIINLDNTHLMQAPSSGSGLVEVVNKGHRVKVVGENDIWYKIRWKGQDAFIRRDNLWYWDTSDS